MQNNIRPIVPISIAGIEPNVLPTGMPIFELVKPTDPRLMPGVVFRLKVDYPLMPPKSWKCDL